MSFTRRQFLATAAVATVAGTKSSAKVLGANDRVRIAVAGLNGRGGNHIDEWAKMKDVEIAYLVDPDTRTYAKSLKKLAGKPAAPKTVQDVRKALEDKELTAISIATPNHWHALMTIWGCQAGKDVYVEKPASHNIHEGRIAVEMARKYNRIVQHGTQSRSSGKWMQLAEIARKGTYGKLLVSRGLVYKDGGTGHSTRGDLGFKPTKAPPAELDFNLWLGPAKDQPYHENLVHYRWHWFWDFGNGDIGNQGVHQMDIARWMIPGAVFPKSVVSFGGRIGFKDQGETACTQVAVMDYGDTQLIFEVRGLKSKTYPNAGSSDNTLHFEAGTVAGGKFYPKGKTAAEPLAKVDLKQEKAADEEAGHFGNFINAVRNRKKETLHADILEGHRSAALIHLANASHRLGKPVPFSDGKARGTLTPAAAEAVDRMQDHLATECKIKLEDWSLTVGKVLNVDAESGMAVGDSAANKLLTREYRKGFAVPEKV